MANRTRTLRNLRSLGLAFCLVAESLVGLTRHAEASGINSPWSGASASVSYFNQTQSNQGATATAQTGGPVTQYFESVYDNPNSPSYYSTQTFSNVPSESVARYFISEQTTGSVQASAGVSLDHLLSVSATGNLSGDPGSIAGGGTRNPVGDASAQWINDSATVTSKSGGNLPDAIRLNFTLTITAPATVDRADLTATINGTPLTFGIQQVGSGVAAISGSTSNVIDTTSLNMESNMTTMVDTFHLLLPLNGTGVSSAFNLGLDLSPNFNLYSGDWYVYLDGLGANLALTSVTLPNGASLASMGDSVSFASGLGSPDVVPEPATLLGWGMTLLIAGASNARRSGNRKLKQNKS